jgi:N-acetylmuramic acid 6-phosphate etherase
LDLKSALEIVTIINREDATVAGAVERSLPRIAEAIDLVAAQLASGGRLIYAGAGSSGRIAALDASECVPTFNVNPKLVRYVIAGGDKALGAAAEYDEDSSALGTRDIGRLKPARKDVIVGVTASGRTPYTLAAVEYARKQGARTVALVCNYGSQLGRVSDLEIVIDVGPEVVSGSTRMKAGTAQKMVLNMISTGAMTRLGYVYGNLMVNVHLQNDKLLERGIAILQRATQTGRQQAEKVLKSAGSVPLALIMLKTGASKAEAVRRLKRARGNVRRALAGD